jgi:sulfofructose kinase
MDKRWDVLGFGAVAVDELIYVDQYPQLDEKVPILRICRQGGGNTATALVTVARFGLRAAYCGVLGDDELSSFSINELEREGVDTSLIIHRKEANPFLAFVIVDITNGKRSIAYSGEGVMEPDPNEISEELISSGRVLFVDHKAVKIGLHAAHFAKRNNIPIVGDFEGQINPDLVELIKLVDHLIIGVDFARHLTGMDNRQDIFHLLSNPNRPCCVITEGENGCWYSEFGGEICDFPAYKVKVQDTTGCGDVFHGAYAAAISQGEVVHRAIQLATAAAGMKALQPGGRAGIPSLTSVEKFIKERGRYFLPRYP